MLIGLRLVGVCLLAWAIFGYWEEVHSGHATSRIQGPIPPNELFEHSGPNNHFYEKGFWETVKEKPWFYGFLLLKTSVGVAALFISRVMLSQLFRNPEK